MSGADRFFSMTLRIAPVQVGGEDATWVCCLNCGAPLEVHQPDSEDPGRFIGTCDQCGRWYLLDWVPLTVEGVMLMLPSHEELQATVGTVGS
jgi:hypothetical protein